MHIHITASGWRNGHLTNSFTSAGYSYADVNFWVKFPYPRPKVFIYVLAIIRQGFELGSPSLHKISILGPYRNMSKIVLIDHDHQGHFGLKMDRFLQI